MTGDTKRKPENERNLRKETKRKKEQKSKDDTLRARAKHKAAVTTSRTTQSMTLRDEKGTANRRIKNMEKAIVIAVIRTTSGWIFINNDTF